MTNNLIDLRKEISAIDEKILELLSRRMELSKEVALYKKANSMQIFDSRREEEILSSYDEKVDFEIRDIFRAIIEESKRIQRGIVL
ncbi:MAG: hypothetical protein HHAS10_04350 [Candidatus Altimarinota bacterium]